MPRRLTQEDFIAKAHRVHGDKYDYSLAKYTKSVNKVKIICPKHGVFEQTASNHLAGKGCPKCAGNVQSNTAEFIAKARRVHGDKYDYSLVNYTKSANKVKIICPEHGVFEQEANSHLQGFGCPKCYNEHGRGRRFDVAARTAKTRATLQKRYGVDNVMQIAAVQQRNQQAKIERGTYQRSKLEDELYRLLVKQFGKADVKRQHIDEDRYPFACDFYVVSRDLFIELNAHWSHGNRWMNPDEVDDKRWGKSGRQYDNLKRAWATTYQLNYVVFWGNKLDDARLWLAMGAPDAQDWRVENSWLPNPDLRLPFKQPTKLSGRQISMAAKQAQQAVFYRRERELFNQPATGHHMYPTKMALYLNRWKYLDKLPNELTNQQLLTGFKIAGLYQSYSGFDNELMLKAIGDMGLVSIFDPFAGWGERAMTAKALGLEYQGIDINPALQPGYQELKAHGLIDEVPMIADARYFSLPAQAVITCPPYYDTEFYTAQGMEALPDLETFLKAWRQVVLCNQDKRYFAFQINQRYKEAMQAVVESGGFELMCSYVSDHQKISHFNRGKHRKMEREEMLVFKKR